MKKHRVLLVILSCIIGLACAEMITRFTHVAPRHLGRYGSYRLTNNQKIVYEFIPGIMEDNSRINAHGFKDSPFTQTKPVNTTRIIMLGDSITQGIDVEYGKTFSDLLEKSLNDEQKMNQSEQQFEVMNFGVCGYNMEAELETLEKKALVFDPDIVILNYYNNDADPIPGYCMFFLAPDESLSTIDRQMIIERYYKHKACPAVIRNLLFSSHLYRLGLQFTSLVYKDRLTYASIFKRLGKVMNDNEMFAVTSMLKKLKTLSSQHGFHCIIAIHPWLPCEDHQNDHCIHTIARTLDIPSFYLSAHYMKEVTDEKDYSVIGIDRCHLNENGHRIAAKAFEIELKRLGVLPTV